MFTDYRNFCPFCEIPVMKRFLAEEHARGKANITTQHIGVINYE